MYVLSCEEEGDGEKQDADDGYRARYQPLQEH